MNFPQVIMGFKENELTKSGKNFKIGFEVDLVLPAAHMEEYRHDYSVLMHHQHPPNKLGYSFLNVEIEKNKKDISDQIAALEARKVQIHEEIDNMEDIEEGMDAGLKAAHGALQANELMILLQEKHIVPRVDGTNIPSLEDEDAKKPALKTEHVFITSEKDIEKEIMDDAIERQEHILEKKAEKIEAIKQAIDRGEYCTMTVTLTGKNKAKLKEAEAAMASQFLQIIAAAKAQMAMERLQ